MMNRATTRSSGWRTVTVAVFSVLAFCTLQASVWAQSATGVISSGHVELAKQDAPRDSLWLLSTRHLTSQAWRANLETPSFRMARIDACGGCVPTTLATFLEEERPGTVDVIYVHGNRMPAEGVIERGLFVYRNIVRHRPAGSPPVRFLIWSWPSERQGLALRDVRIKAARTDAQALYLAWLLREQTHRGRVQRVVGFSFGGRVATGALHALAGGTLGGRQLPGVHLEGAEIGVGLLAPAIGEDWLMPGRDHGRATLNISHITLLFNQRDAILRRYPLLDPASGVEALGYRGPRNFGPGFDGRPVNIFQMNCSDTVGLRHREDAYYTGRCQAGARIYMMSIRNAF
ncbi:MAG: hypothetical protein WD119_02205 [Pirellulaceae bacterium]